MTQPNPIRFPSITPEARTAVFKHIDYTPSEAQRQFHDSSARFKVLVAGSRFGKSLAAAREVLPWLNVDESRGWIVGPSYRLAEKEFRYLAEDCERLFGGEASNVRIRRGGAHGPSSIITPHGAEVLTLSAADPSNLMGEELNWLILAEGAWLESEVWSRFLRARLTTRHGVMILPTTPAGFNWVHELFLRGPDESHPEWASFQFPTSANPHVAKEDIEEARRTLPSHIFEEQYLGRFVQPSGLVYGDFSPDLHVCDTATLAGIEGAATVGGMDFGYSAPFILLMGSVLGNGQLVIRRELRHSGLTLLQLMPFIAKAGARELEVIWCDPSNPGQITDLRRAGFSARASRNDVQYGIELVRRRLVVGPAGMPGLLVDRSCMGLIREFMTYSYGSTDFGPDRIGGPVGRERSPEKANDHALDALRYICLHLHDGGAGTKWRVLR